MDNYESFIYYKLAKIGWRGKIFLLTIAFVFLLSVIFLLYHYSPYKFILNSNNVIVGIGGGILIFIVNYWISYLRRNRNQPGSEVKDKLSVLRLLFTSDITKIVFIVCSASIEEILFRSYILAYSVSAFGMSVSVGINAILFYLVHFNKKVVELLLMGALFSIFTLYTNSIASAIIAHSVNNIGVYLYRKYLIRHK